MADRTECPVCHRLCKVTKDGRLYGHRATDGGTVSAGARQCAGGNSGAFVHGADPALVARVPGAVVEGPPMVTAMMNRSGDSPVVTDQEFGELIDPLIRKITEEMRKERGASVLDSRFLVALAVRAALAAGAYMGDPRSLLKSAPEQPAPPQGRHARNCPGCGQPYAEGPHGRACLHTADCTAAAGRGPQL